jgi:hypothetical protein
VPASASAAPVSAAQHSVHSVSYASMRERTQTEDLTNRGLALSSHSTRCACAVVVMLEAWGVSLDTSLLNSRRQQQQQQQRLTIAGRSPSRGQEGCAVTVSSHDSLRDSTAAVTALPVLASLVLSGTR